MTKETGETTKTGRRPRQYCTNGHDTFSVGRDSQGHCKLCRSEKAQEPKPTLEFQGLYTKEHAPFTFDDYVQLYMDQGKKCRVCDTEGRNYPDGLQADTNTKAEVKGLLCPPCLSLIKYLREKPQVLNTVSQYLKLYQ